MTRLFHFHKGVMATDWIICQNLSPIVVMRSTVSRDMSEVLLLRPLNVYSHYVRAFPQCVSLRYLHTLKQNTHSTSMRHAHRRTPSLRKWGPPHAAPHSSSLATLIRTNHTHNFLFVHPATSHSWNSSSAHVRHGSLFSFIGSHS